MQTLIEAGWLGWIQVALGLGGFVWALVCAVLLGLRWKVPPVLATAPLFAHAAVLAASGLFVSSAINSPSGAEADRVAMELARALTEVINNRLLGLAALPTALVLLLGGAAAGVRGRRAWGAPGVAAFVGLAVAAVPLYGIVEHVPLPLVAIRFLLYGAAALPLIGALCGAHPQDNSREGALVAVAAYATVVAVGESLVIGQVWRQAFQSLAMVGGDTKGTFVVEVVKELRGYGNLAGITLGLAAIPAVVALLRPAAELTEEEILSGTTSPSTLRWLGGALALVVPLAWGAAFVCADAAAIMSAVGAAAR